ncbi:BCCT family transporter [Aliidiomarina taiwanensis]|nr:BCCT family transporter [Aliidiomarina taiwanensis]
MPHSAKESQSVSPEPALHTLSNRIGDPIILTISMGFIALFIGSAIYDTTQLTAFIGRGFGWTAEYMGSFFQLMLLATFFIAIGVALSRAGQAKIGNLEKPEISTFRWLSMVMCTLLAGGGVFFAAGEPIYHFVVTPPAFDVESGTAEAVAPALAQSFMHWGFLAWAVLGSLTAIVLAYAHYNKGKPLQPRTLLYPVFGEKILTSWVGSVVDALCVIAIVAGTVGPIGFLATQMSYGLHVLFGLSNGFTTQLCILMLLATVYIVSAMTGIHKGIQVLSRFNVFLALAIGAVIFLFGPTQFLINVYLQSLGEYTSSFFEMATMTSETAPDWWMQWWTVFFFAWFIGYAPLMAIFVARISRGRTIREMITAVAVLAPIATTVWFTLIGGSGIYFELTGVVDLATSLENFSFDVATLAVAQALPGGTWMAAAVLLLTTIFVATTGDSMSYSIAVVGAGHDAPHFLIRAFWGGAMAIMAGILLYMGEGQIGVLQQFIVITATPVSFILLPSLWAGPKAAFAMAREQNLVK